MPYVTEELWQRLPKPDSPQPKSIMLANYPTPQQEWRSSALEEEFEHLLEIVRAVRKLRTGATAHLSTDPSVKSLLCYKRLSHPQLRGTLGSSAVRKHMLYQH